MEELNLDSESETESDDVVEIVPEAVEEQKTQKQSQITDFFRSKKNKRKFESLEFLICSLYGTR